LTLNENLRTQGDEWKKVHVFPWILQTVARASNRIFVGAPFCRDQKWLDFNISGPAEAVGISIVLNLFPRWMLPIVGPLLGPANRRVRKGAKMVGPLIEERLSMDQSHWPDDFITWLLVNAPESDRTVDEITRRLLVVNFAAIHTSSLSMGHALYWLLARPKYMIPLREEIEETVGRLGWTKDAIGQMPKLESFMKESMRMSPLGALSLSRKVLKPFTFSNGVTLPVGTYVAAHLHGTHRDGSTYEAPEEFDGFRFVDEKPKSEVDEGKAALKPRQTMYTTSKTYLAFGHGRHACPGRFFASMELKMMMAYLILNYDMKWPEEVHSNPSATEQGYRPPDLWINFNSIPNQKAHMMIRKRV